MEGAEIEVRLFALDALDAPEKQFKGRTDANGTAWVEVELESLIDRFFVLVSAHTDAMYGYAQIAEYSPLQEPPAGSPESGWGIVVEMDPTVEITGSVTEEGSGLPIKGAEVRVEGVTTIAPSYTDANGAFRISGFPANEEGYTFLCCANGYAEESLLLHAHRDGTWKRTDPFGETERQFTTPIFLRFEMLPELMITGTVRSEEEGPVSGAEVDCSGFYSLLPDVALPDQASTKTQADGTFTLMGLRPDITHQLSITKDPYAVLVLETPSQRLGSYDCGTLWLDRECTVQGVVREVAGTPAAGLEVYLTGPLESARGMATAKGEDRDALVRPGPSRSVVTAPDGQYTFKGLARGGYRLFVAETERIILVRALSVGQRDQYTEVVLPPGESHLVGRVLLGGEPAPDALVQVSRAGRTRVVRADSKGAFQVFGIGVGESYELQAVLERTDGSSYRSEVRSIEGSAPFIELRLVASADRP